MNRRMILCMLGQILTLEAGLMLLPLEVSLIYREYHALIPFLTTILLSLSVGIALQLICRVKNQVIFAREGFMIVTLAWIMLSLFGALPFYLSREIPSYIDAFFETVSGFTTTGASILTDVERMSHGMLFWRSFTHWIGGMGIIVLIMAILPTSNGRTMHIMRAEMPGPIVGKLVPKVRDTAKILYVIYIVLTLIEATMLICGGMSPFDSFVHSFGTAGTGGFGIHGDCLARYSPYCQWVIAIFMLIFGVNFNLYYLLLIRRFRSVFKSEELRAYIGIVLVSVTAITLNIRGLYHTFSEALRHSVFQVASIITTTGYSTSNFDLWSGLSKGIIFLLLFVGGCAGSTAGGLKISRVLLLFRSIKNSVRKMTHPRSVSAVQFEGKSIDEATQKSVSGYFAMYMFILAGVFLLISYEPFGLEANLTAAISCFNNVGPGFQAIGPFSSYAAYSPASKLVLSAAMLLGRLEVYPLIAALSLSSWVKKE